MADVQNEIIDWLQETTYLASKTVRNLLFPRDFEVYMCGIELTDFDGNTIDYFIFPVTPNSINKVENDRISYYRTFGGITILNADSFTPSQLTIQGNFGRNFKLLLSTKQEALENFKALRFSASSGVYRADDVNSQFTQKSPTLIPNIKTGFGCIKILQSIINKARGNDNGKPFRLYFYNSMLSEAYLVIPTKNPLQLNQDINSSNMMWNYTLNLEIISPLDNLVFDDKEKTMKDFLVAGTIQQGVGSMANKASKLASSLIRQS